MLLIFATNQVAVAYEHCDDPQCSFFSADKHENKDQKGGESVHHCCGIHAMHLPSTDIAGASPELASITWPATQDFASISPSAPLEPPSNL